MSKRQVDLIVLCEDRQHQTFLYRLLTGLGYHPRRIRTRVCPPGVGSAEQWVRREYPVEVRAQRQRRERINLGLLTMMDADARTVEEEHRQLDLALETDGQARRQSGERISLQIPKWELETWIWWLLGKGSVTEDDDPYKRQLGLQGRESQCQPAVDRLTSYLTRAQPLPDDCPPSLKRACMEFDRLPPQQ